MNFKLDGKSMIVSRLCKRFERIAGLDDSICSFLKSVPAGLIPFQNAI